jgi:hypothetical protein
MFDGASAALIDFDAARPDVTAQAAVGIFSGETAVIYERDFSAFDPAPPAFMKQPVGTVIPTYRLLPNEVRRPGVFFAEFFRPLGLEECLGGTLASANGRFAMIGVQRAPDRKAFDDEDIATLERLMPHLSRALQLRRCFLTLGRREAALAEVCDRLVAGFVAVDEQGRTSFANEAARRLSAQNDGVALDRHGRPYAVDRVANQRLAELARDVASGGSGGVVRVSRPQGKTAYVLMVAPLALEDGVEAGGRRSRGTVYVIHDPLFRLPAAPQRVAEMFGLPIGSATIVAALAAGEDLKDYAERSGISTIPSGFISRRRMREPACIASPTSSGWSPRHCATCLTIGRNPDRRPSGPKRASCQRPFTLSP